MRVFKSKDGGHIIVGGEQVDIPRFTQQLAEAFAKELVKELKKEGLALAGTDKKVRYGELPNNLPGPEGLQIDESTIDVGVSTEGLEQSSQKPLAKEEATDQSISKSVNKLKKLKKK